MTQTLYVLKGDIEEYDYEVFGVFDSKEKLLQAANETIAKDFAVAEFATENYNFSGLVYYPLELNKLSDIDNKYSIYWNAENAEASFRAEN